jgi:hypothetical protein
MTGSRAAAPLMFIANLAVFGACACLAFVRNVDALFHHYDGTYMLTDAREQLQFGQLCFEYSNNLLQSVGNIQFMQNARLLFFYWPIGWFSNVPTAKIGCYLIVAAIVFGSAYGMARLLAQPRAVALAAGWILGFVTMPFVPMPYFYPIISLTPDYVVIVAAPVVTFWLVSRAGRLSSLAASGISVLALIGLTFYLLAAAPLLLPIYAPGMALYAVMALCLVRDQTELLRKFAILAVVLIVMSVLRWPWYVLGLFLDTAPNVFPNDFTVVYHDKWSASIMFQQKMFGSAGPRLAASAAFGALLSLRSADRELRVAAWALLALVATFIGAAVALNQMPHWIFPPPVYFEVAIWPLYGVFAAILLVRISAFVAEQLARFNLWPGNPLRLSLIVPFTALVFAAVIVMRKPVNPINYPFPPQVTPVVALLKSTIALDSGSSFKGRILTAIPTKSDGDDAWQQQLDVASNWAKREGNDELSLGLWYHRIPTLFEYNQFISPEFHALIRRALQRPPIAHQRNVTVLTYPNAPVLKLLGVRYVLMPHPDASLGTMRATEDRAGTAWALIELSKPNLATYSPTLVETRRDLASTLDFVVADGVDLSKQAVAREEIGGPLVPVRYSALSMVDKDLHVVAESDGRSLVIVPLEFSRCVELQEAHAGEAKGPLLFRIDGLLTGIVFERHLDVVLSFRIGPLHNPLCRWEDYREMKSMMLQ